MKNKFLVFLGLAAMVVLGGCKENWEDSPTLKTHEGVLQADFLNEPAMQNQYLMITQENRDGSFHLSCSQPDYGYAAFATYKVQVCLDENFNEGEYVELNQSFYNCSNINPLNSDVASAMEKLAGIQTEEDLPLNYTSVYMRLRAFIEQSAENTQYVSNVICFRNIGVDYLAVWTPGLEVNIYLRGGWDEGWAALAEWQFVTGEEENTWVIESVHIAAGTEFKVADSSWGPLNLGANDAGNVVAIGEPYELNGGDNPGNLKITEDFTGKAVLSLQAGKYYLTLDPEN